MIFLYFLVIIMGAVGAMEVLTGGEVVEEVTWRVVEEEVTYFFGDCFCSNNWLC